MSRLFQNIIAVYVAACLVMLSFPLPVFAAPIDDEQIQDYSRDDNSCVLDSSVGEAEPQLELAASYGEFALKVTPSATVSNVNETIHFDIGCENLESLVDPEVLQAGGVPTIQYKLDSIYQMTENGWVSPQDTSYTSYSSTFTSYEYTPITAYSYLFTFSALLKIPTGADAEGNMQYKYDYVRNRVEIKVVNNGSPTAAQIVDSIIAECNSQGFTTDYEKALWLHDWLIDNCSYSLRLIGIDEMFVGREGNCEAYHGAYMRLLNRVGIQTGRIESKGDWHVWTAAKLDGKWYQIDVTEDDASLFDQTKYPDNRHLCFGLTDDIMRLVHRQYTEPNTDYTATSLDDNYFIKTGKIKTWSDPYKSIIQNAIDKKQTSITIDPLNNDWAVTYNTSRVVINALVAFQLNTESWTDGKNKVTVKVTHNPGERNTSNQFVIDENGNVKDDFFTVTLSYADTTTPTTPTNPTTPTTPTNPSNPTTPSTPSNPQTPTPQTPQVQKVTMYRVYNPNSGEHLYTQDPNEYKVLGSIGWKQEGIAWYSPASGTPVYRLYNPNSGDHHYTIDSNEYNSLGGIGWKKEGVAWYSQGNTLVYRLFNPNVKVGTHHYTTDTNEYNALRNIGWRAEGVGWYGL